MGEYTPGDFSGVLRASLAAALETTGSLSKDVIPHLLGVCAAEVVDAVSQGRAIAGLFHFAMGLSPRTCWQKSELCDSVLLD